MGSSQYIGASAYITDPAPIPNPLAEFFLWASKTDRRLMRLCATSTRKTHVSRGFFVLATALAAAGASYYFMLTTVAAHAWAVPVSLLWGAVIFMFDRELVGGWNLRLVWPRILLSFLLGATVAIPVELRVLEPRLNQQILRDHATENAAAVARLQQRQTTLDARKSSLEDQLAQLRSQQQEAIRNKEAEVVGRVIAGETTGIKGEGPAWRAADQRLHELQAQIADIENELPRIEADRAQASADYKQQEIAAVYDFPTRYEALKKATPWFTPLWQISWMITLVFILFDMYPVLSKVLADPSEYDRLVRAQVEENIHRAHKLSQHKRDLIDSDYLTRHPSTVELFEGPAKPET